MVQTVVDTLHFKIAHEDITVYNAVQKLLYIIVILAGISQVITGLAIWKPIQFSGLVSLLGGFQTARVLHFAGMAVIVGFLIVHVALALARAEDVMGDADRRAARHCDSRVSRAKRRSRDMKSPFRPDMVPDAAILDDHKPLIRSLERRGLIRGGLSLGALVYADRMRLEASGSRSNPHCWRYPGSTMACRRCCSIRTSWRRPIPRR